MQLVDRVRSGHVFLAGDAAHLNPPFDSHGLNTVFDDAVDLRWKPSAVYIHPVYTERSPVRGVE